jgi:thiol-disulfide isomerase/thioredoxin
LARELALCIDRGWREVRKESGGEVSRRVTIALAALSLAALAHAVKPSLVRAQQPRTASGQWRAALALAGGPLRFSLALARAGTRWTGQLCNGRACQALSTVRVTHDSLTLEIADYAATIEASLRGDSLIGNYHNVGNRGPRVIPFRAARGTWPVEQGSANLLGQWDATMFQDWRTSPRVFEFRNGPAGLEGTIVSNSGDYGHFSGTATADSFSLAHFDGSFVYLLTGRVDGDTLRGVFHAGLRAQTPWKAVRSTGAPHLKPPTEITRADTTAPFAFAFPDLSGRMVQNTDRRFAGKVVLVDVFGTWCPTCHDAAPTLARLWRKYHSRGLEIVGLAFEVTGDTAVDARQVRRYRDKFEIPFPLLLAGINDTEAAAATLPQLQGFTAFPTTIFLGRDGRVRRVHAGFYGAATGEQHDKLVRDFEGEIERLLAIR